MMSWSRSAVFCAGLGAGALGAILLLSVGFLRLPYYVPRTQRAVSDLIPSTGAGRRVAAGHDAAGQSVVFSDAAASYTEDFGDVRYVELWRPFVSPAAIDASEADEPTSGDLRLTQPGGSVLRQVDFAPSSLGGKRTPMHRTETIDYGIVHEGEAVLILGTSEVTLKQGGVVIQRGTERARENRSDKPPRMAFVMIDRAFSTELSAQLPDVELTR
jgi:hypothetical protein